MTSQDPPVLVVDDDDRPIGSAPRAEVQAKGLRHRIARLVLHSPDGKILLAKRGKDRNYYPDCWGESVAGHVDEGENYLKAMLRETQEEIGVSGFEIEEVGRYKKDLVYDGRFMNRFNKVYKGTIPADTQFRLEKPAVAEVGWFTLDEVKQLITDHPDQVTEALIEIIDRYYS